MRNNAQPFALPTPRVIQCSSTLAIATLAAAGWAVPALALTFSGESTGRWGDPTQPANSSPLFSGVGTSTFSWGQLFQPDAGINQLVFEGTRFSTEPGQLFKLGELTYANGTILASTEVESVPLNLELAIAPPMALSPIFTLNFAILTTPNNGTPEENADAVFPTIPFGEHIFKVNGREFTLSLAGFSQDEGLTLSNQFRVLEDDRTTASLFGKIVLAPDDDAPRPPNSVPEPESLLGLGLFCLMGALTRRALQRSG